MHPRATETAPYLCGLPMQAAKAPRDLRQDPHEASYSYSTKYTLTAREADAYLYQRRQSIPHENFRDDLKSAYLGVQLKSPVRCKKHDAGWAERIFCREKDAEVIQSALKVGSLRAA